jgi:hypothetical protein
MEGRRGVYTPFITPFYSIPDFKKLIVSTYK